MKLGKDVLIDPMCAFKHPDYVEIDDHSAIDFAFYCTTKLTIGKYCHISSHVSVIGGRSVTLILEGYNFISTGARMILGSEEYMGHGLVGPKSIPVQYRDNCDYEDIVLERFAGVAANSIVLPGVTLREGAILGANSMLKKDAEPWTIYAGNPAQPIKMRPYGNMEEYAEILDNV